MSKITKLRIHQKACMQSKTDCPMKSENSGTGTTVATLQMLMYKSAVIWATGNDLVYCTFVSLFFHSPLLENLFRLSTA